MSGIEDLFEAPPQEPAAWAGTIASAPESVDTPCKVLIPAFAPDQVFEGVRWSPRIEADGSVRLPARGDECLVAIDDNGDFWIVSWWPYGE